MVTVTKRKEAQRQAAKFRRENPKLAKRRTVNVVEVSKGSWGIRFSDKGTRDKKFGKTGKYKRKR